VSLFVVACGNSSKDSAKTGGTGGMNGGGAGDTSATGGTSGATGGGGSTAAGSGGTGGSSGTGGTSHGGSGGSAGLAGSAAAGGRAGAAGASGAAGGGVCDHTLDNQACWSSVDVYSLTRNEPGFYGAIFDGQHIVFPNGTTGYYDYHLQLDTHGDFMHAWKSFNTNPGIGNGYRGGTFDGRYVYLTPTQPENNGAAGLTYDCVAARYDTQADFASSGAWSSFNLTQKSGTPDLTVPGYRGAAFDGRYVYFAPGFNGDGPSGNATRYDTMAPFDDKASWTDYDLTDVDANAVSFDGAVLAGKYLYFVPESMDSLAARYDTTAPFDDKTSWTTFDTTTLDPNAWLFNGGVFDGRYVYFVPNNQNTDQGLITRYDTQASFEDASSWATYNPIGTGFTDSDSFGGGAYDGRYVYFVPTASQYLVRYDTKLPFDSPDAWTKHRMASETTGAAFDGRYLYVVPQGFGSIQRFEARAENDPGPTQASFY
jgi:hypothetical protein